ARVEGATLPRLTRGPSPARSPPAASARNGRGSALPSAFPATASRHEQPLLRVPCARLGFQVIAHASRPGRFGSPNRFSAAASAIGFEQKRKDKSVLTYAPDHTSIPAAVASGSIPARCLRRPPPIRSACTRSEIGANDGHRTVV